MSSPSFHNELTQKAIAKECADWIRRKVTFKSNVTGEQMMGFMTVDQSTYIKRRLPPAAMPSK